MLVYGDRERETRPRLEIARLSALPARLGRTRGRLARHARLVSAFIDAAELAQGLADAAIAPDGAQGDTPAAAAAMAVLRLLAGAVCRSCAGVGAADEHWWALHAGLDALAAAPLPRTLRCRQQEGYAFYALYPEAYAQAARRLGGPVGAVIGIRSIGIGLGAIAAEAVAAPLLLSVRPVGPPFERTVRLPAGAADQLRAASGSVAIADEGPGLSGSSFAAVSRALSAAGIGTERQRFLPSHAGAPGPAAGAQARAIWEKVSRQAAACDPALDVQGHLGSLADWCADLAGPATAPLVDLGPRWPGAAAEAPRAPAFERRKFLLRTREGAFLLRFAGLGRYGAATLRRARRLARAGWTPDVLGLRHGFLVERWIEPSQPLPGAGAGRAAFLDHLAAYLAFRRRHLPAPAGSGASLPDLAAMLAHNAGQALGRSVPAQAWLQRAHRLAGHVHRVEVDGRLHRWEWLVQPDGRILKADAVDHCAGHDLVGCQDITWDVAGAIFEHDLSRQEGEQLLRAMERHGAPVCGPLLAFLRPCYLAFQLGLWWTGRGAPSAGREEELFHSYVRKLDLELNTSNMSVSLT